MAFPSIPKSKRQGNQTTQIQPRKLLGCTCMKDDDDDIQDYVSNNFAQTFKQVVRNETLEEVAREIEKMKAFGQDTISSFAVYIRSMKR